MNTTVKGHHEPLIDFGTFQRVQERLKQSRYATRNGAREDFPLRGFVVCADCNTPLTAGWSKGRDVHYQQWMRGNFFDKANVVKLTLKGGFPTNEKKGLEPPKRAILSR